MHSYSRKPFILSKAMSRSGVVIAAAALLLIGCKKEEPKPQEAPPVAVETEPASRSEIIETLGAVGSIQPNETVDLRPEAEGVVKAFYFDEGQVVEAGQKLFELDSGKESAQLAKARADAEIARITLERSQTLAGTKAISQQEIDDWKARLAAREAEVTLYEERLDDTIITAPLRGVMGARHVSVGQYVTPSTVLVTLVDLSDVKVVYGVPEQELARLRIGQPVNIRVAAWTEREFSGKVDFIDPVVNETTRMASVRAVVPNNDGRLKAGMFARVETVVDRRPSAIVIPERALLPSLRGFSVYVVEDSKALLTPVKIGARQPGRVEILQGLEPGQQIVVAGTQKLVDGAKVAAAPHSPANDNPAGIGANLSK